MSAMVMRSAAIQSRPSSRRLKNLSAFSALSRLYSPTAAFCCSSAAIAGWVCRTPIIIGWATISSARRIHISMTPISSGVRPNRLGSG